MGNYPHLHAASMATSARNDITSPRGNIEPHQQDIDTMRRSSTLDPTASLGGNSYTGQEPALEEPPRLETEDRRPSCSGQMSAFEHRRLMSSSPSLSSSSSSTPQAYLSIPSQQPQRNSHLSISAIPSSPSHLSNELAQSDSPTDETAFSSTVPAPPSAVLLKDLLSNRASMLPPPGRLSPYGSPAHSRNGSLTRASTMSPYLQQEDGQRRSMAFAADRRSRMSTLTFSASSPYLVGGASASSASLASAPALGLGPGLGQQGQRDSYYQYGEDYITRYDRVGRVASPAPSIVPGNNSSTTSLALAFPAGGDLNGLQYPRFSQSQPHLWTSGGASGTYHANRSDSRLGSRSPARTSLATWEGGWGDVGRDVETACSERSGSRFGMGNRNGSGFSSGSSSSGMTEKSLRKRRREQAEDDSAATQRWISWPRLLAFVLAVLVLAGIAVGIGFGVR